MVLVVMNEFSRAGVEMTDITSCDLWRDGGRLYLFRPCPELVTGVMLLRGLGSGSLFLLFAFDSKTQALKKYFSFQINPCRLENATVLGKLHKNMENFVI